MKQAESSTVIGRSVKIRGELSGKEDLYMDGDMEGTVIVADSRLSIGPNARILADVQARDVVVMGTLTGNIRAMGKVELQKTAVVYGDIFADRLSIEENAVFKGHVELKA